MICWQIYLEVFCQQFNPKYFIGNNNYRTLTEEERESQDTDIVFSRKIHAVQKVKGDEEMKRTGE